MYRQILDPVGGSLASSASFAVLPLGTLFVLLDVLRIKAWIAALSSLGVAIVVYSTPVGQTLLSATEGASIGFFPILWIGLNAIWVSFGALQVQTAKDARLDTLLLPSANSSGGVLGKMISPPNLAIVASAVGRAGQEGVIFRKVIGSGLPCWCGCAWSSGSRAHLCSAG
jgi:L-lactate permease